MDVARWLLPVIVLGPFLVAAVAVAWVLAVRLRRINAESKSGSAPGRASWPRRSSGIAA